MTLFFSTLWTGCVPPAAESRPVRSRAPRGPGIERVDLDGDGRPEAVSLQGRQLRVGGMGAISLDGLYAAADPVQGPLSLRVLDLDRRTRSRELAVVAQAPYGQQWLVVSAAKGRPKSGLVFVPAEPDLPGDGTMTTRFTNCGVTEIDVYALRNGALARTDHTEVPSSDPTCGG